MTANAEQDQALREHLCRLLEGREAFTPVAEVVADFPAELRGRTVPGVPWTAWELLEHMRITQRDILEFTRDARHESPPFPEGYWPEHAAPDTEQAWERSVGALLEDLGAFQELVRNPKLDILGPLPHGGGLTTAREAMLVAEHTAYHIGQFVLLRRLLGIWPPSGSG